MSQMKQGDPENKAHSGIIIFNDFSLLFRGGGADTCRVTSNPTQYSP
jgi:hypothetical protein